MATIGDIIARAMRASGVLGTGQTALAQDSTDALATVNDMIGQWNGRRWLTYVLVDTAFPCDGSLSYTVGAGQDFDIPRPDRLEAAYIRQTVVTNPTPIDWPLAIIPSREMYSEIALKTLAASPSEYIWYESSYPVGHVFPYPVPSNQYELHLLTKIALASYPNLAANIVLPDMYNEAINYSLQIRLRSAYRLPADPTINGLARAALATIRKANAQISNLRMPLAITRGGSYNPYSDSFGGR